MLKIEQAIIVEGKYDKIKLSSIIDGVIIETNGFGVFKDKEKLDLIKFYAKHRGIIILTDSDSAGFKIRNYIKGTVPDGKITNVYIPDIFGKEKRKIKPSCEGKIGVEGVEKDILLEAFKKAGIIPSEKASGEAVTNMDFYEMGLIGMPDSHERRKKLLAKLGMPELLSTKAMLEAINSVLTLEQFKNMISEIDGEK